MRVRRQHQTLKHTGWRPYRIHLECRTSVMGGENEYLCTNFFFFYIKEKPFKINAEYTDEQVMDFLPCSLTRFAVYMLAKHDICMKYDLVLFCNQRPHCFSTKSSILFVRVGN